MDGSARLLLVVMLGKAELAQVPITVPAVEEPDVVPAVPLERVLWFARRFGTKQIGGDRG